MRRLLRDLNCGTPDQLDKDSLYFYKDTIAHTGKKLAQDDSVVAFWEWNVNVYTNRSRKFWEVLEKMSDIGIGDVKYIWLVGYRQLLNFENMSKLLLLFPNIRHIIVTKCEDVPIGTIKMVYNTYFKRKFALIIMDSEVVYCNNKSSYVSYMVCK